MIGVHRMLAVAAIVLGGGAAASETMGSAEPYRLARDIAEGRGLVTALELAERIAAGRGPRLFDLRPRADFEQFHIPSAEHAPLDRLLELPLPHSASVVLYAEDAERAAQAWTLMRLRGYRDVAYLQDGLYEWIARIHEPALALDATPAERGAFERLATLSRYFGGQPRVDVPRGELPAGYWSTASGDDARPSVETALLVAAIRRRGC